MKKILTSLDIECIDIELVGKCNLRCPLCISQLNYNNICKFNYVNINKLIHIIKQFKNLKTVYIAGDYSEPTLHPQLCELLDFLKLNKHIRTCLFTNGQLYDDQYWANLGKHFSNNSEIIFTICGSTQQLHEKYRAGSNLDVIIQHALSFKNENNNDIMQYIKFEYNKNDDIYAIMNICKQFSNYIITNTNMIEERFSCKTHEKDGLCAEKHINVMYKYMIKKTISQFSKQKIQCYSFENKVIKIDNFLNFYPCSCWQLFKKNNTHDYVNNNLIFDYQKILSNEYLFCYECCQMMNQFFLKNNTFTFYGSP